MNIDIRPATVLDADQIAKVHILSWKAAYQNHIPQHLLDNLSQEKRSYEWREVLKKSTEAWVIDDQKSCLGFASICPTRDADDDPNKVIEISAIYLLPEFWGKGLGQKLCQVIFNHVTRKGFKEVTLWVLESNNQARHFYESLGFFTHGDIKMDHVGCEKLPVIRYRKILEPMSQKKS